MRNASSLHKGTPAALPQSSSVCGASTSSRAATATVVAITAPVRQASAAHGGAGDGHSLFAHPAKHSSGQQSFHQPTGGHAMASFCNDDSRSVSGFTGSIASDLEDELHVTHKGNVHAFLNH